MAPDSGMAGSAGAALRKTSQPQASGRRLEGMPQRQLPPLRTVGVESLGFNPRQDKDVLAGQAPEKALSERGSALALQQCLAINLINLLHQVVGTIAGTEPSGAEELSQLPPPPDIFRQDDSAILALLESHFTRLQEQWVKRDRSRRLPGLCQLFAVAHERPLMPRRALRAVMDEARITRPWLPEFDLGSNGRGLQELFRFAEASAASCPGLARLHPVVVQHFECYNLPKLDDPAQAAVSLEEARKKLLEGTAGAAEMRVLREHQTHQEEDAQPTEKKPAGGEAPGQDRSKRRKSSGHFFVWGECVMPKTERVEESADDLLMADLAASAEDEESKEKKKKAHGGRKRRVSMINDEVEPTKVVDDQGVFHFGDFAVDTVGGGYDYGGYGSGIDANAAGQFAFGDFAIGLDEETIRKHAQENKPKAKPAKKQELAIPKKAPKPEGLRLVGFRQYCLIGHAARVKCIAVSPDEQHIISCSHEDLIVTMSDLVTGKEMVSFSGHDDTLTSVGFSSDQKHIATTSRDQNLILWDAITAKVVMQFEHEKVVICCAWSKSGRFIVSGCQDKICRVWDTKKGKERASFTDHTAIVISLDFAPDDKQVVSASADKTVRIWQASSGQSIKVLKGHQGIVLCCRYLPDGKQILSNDESEIKLWDVKTGACKLSMHVENMQMNLPVARTKKRLTWTLCSACPGDFGSYIIASCNLRTVIVVDRNTGEEVLTMYTRAPVYCLASSAGNKVVFGDSLGNIYVMHLNGV
eukprot:TRINITY_DN22641_c0_g1_i1.p1 TRINITY_DN22641_c0_g1~~TRINITY_DN22641_c0_g1_i1.p1  ORF type:complete len:754 (+),score=202.83 TRINITY_DN22641_c0_g1_i1:105-2366(+)